MSERSALTAQDWLDGAAEQEGIARHCENVGRYVAAKTARDLASVYRAYAAKAEGRT